MTFEDARRIALGFPGVEEGTSYGTPAFRVGKAFLTRLHDSRTSMVIGMDFDTREMRLEAAPEVFHITDHYRAWPMVLVRLATCSEPEWRALFERAWRERAPRRLVAATPPPASSPPGRP